MVRQRKEWLSPQTSLPSPPETRFCPPLPSSGLTTDKATDAVAAWLEARGLGAKKVNYKLRDWLFARQARCFLSGPSKDCNANLRLSLHHQRYWGEPFPIVFPDGSDEAVPLREGAPRPLPPPAFLHSCG